MKIINKYRSDIVLSVNVLVGRIRGGKRFARVSSFDNIYFTFYTQDPGNCIVCKYERGVYEGIIRQEKGDFCILNESDVAGLEDGLLRYTFEYELFTSHPDIRDGIYSYKVKSETDIYLETPKHYIQHVC